MIFRGLRHRLLLLKCADSGLRYSVQCGKGGLGWVVRLGRRRSATTTFLVSAEAGAWGCGFRPHGGGRRCNLPPDSGSPATTGASANLSIDVSGNAQGGRRERRAERRKGAARTGKVQAMAAGAG